MSDDVSRRSSMANSALSAYSVSNPVTLACPQHEMVAHKSVKRGNRTELYTHSLRSAIQQIYRYNMINDL